MPRSAFRYPTSQVLVVRSDFSIFVDPRGGDKANTIKIPRATEAPTIPSAGYPICTFCRT